MAETTPVESAQESAVKVGSEEWIRQTLTAKGMQGEDEPEAEPEAHSTPQGSHDPEADAASLEEQREAQAASDWRKAVVIPPDDESVPKEYRGITAEKFFEDHMKTLAAGTTQQQKLREYEAKLAAKETLEEFLQAAKLQQKQAPVETPDPYREAGLDPETDPVLNPTKFHAVQEQVFLNKAEQRFDEKLAKIQQQQAAEAQKRQTYNAAAQAIDQAVKARGLDKLDAKQREERIAYMMFKTSMTYDKDPTAIFDPNKLLEAHDVVWGNQVPAEAAIKPNPPDPPGVKKSAAIESAKPSGPQLKSYQREAMMAAADQLKRAGFKDIDTERFAARYAANLKRSKE